MIDETAATSGAVAPASWVRARYDPLPLDAFGATPHFASRLTGLGGDMPAPDPSYVFATMVVQPAVGRIVFTILIGDLAASKGTLIVRVIKRPTHNWANTETETRTFFLAELAENNGLARIEVIGRKNTWYALEGWIEDETDATASGIGISLDRREQADDDWEHPADRLASALPPLRALPELVTARAPTLTTPVSQPMTARQFGERIFGTLMATLGGINEPSGTNWRDAYVLQALRYYSAPIESGRGFGVTSDKSMVPGYLSGRGGSILTATVQWPDGADPSRTFSVSAPDDDGVHRTSVDLRSLPEEIANLDFFWTINIQNSKEGRNSFPQFLLDSMHRLKLGGLAVHVFPHEGMHAGQYRATPTGYAYTRAEIERMAISLVAAGQEIAQLTFAADDQRRANREKPVPFGLIARRRR